MLKEKLQIFYNNQQIENLTVSQRDPVILNASFSSINDVTPAALWLNDDSVIPCIQTNTESCAIQPNTVNVTILTYTVRATFCGKSLDIESFMLIVEGWYYNYPFTCNCLFSTSFSACYKENRMKVMDQFSRSPKYLIYTIYFKHYCPEIGFYLLLM